MSAQRSTVELIPLLESAGKELEFSKAVSIKLVSLVTLP